jgi:hypothetical protein
MFYTVMGFQFYHDDQYDTVFDEHRGAINLVEDPSPGVACNDGCNRYERHQRLLKATNPPDLECNIARFGVSQFGRRS